MNRVIWRTSVRSWLVFLTVLSVTLLYGLQFRSKGNTDEIAGTANQVAAEQVLAKEVSAKKVKDAQEASLNRKPVLYGNDSFEKTIAASTTDPTSEPSTDPFTEVKREAVLMGSQFVFIVDAPKQQALASITEAANAIKKLENLLSSWKPGSDISRLNEHAGRHSVKVSTETMELLLLAKGLEQKTQGTFDITVGSVWDIWPFRDRNAPLPSQSEIDQSLQLVDSSTIVIDQENQTAYLPKIGMKVNLGAIGKGYAAELAINTMRNQGIKRAAVSAGGDLYLLGVKRSGPWAVELEHPRWKGRYLDRFVATDISVATSGDAKQYIERNGKRYGHIIDPRTGWPADKSQSVTIMTESSILADAYATAVYVMGPEEGINWVENQTGVEALIVDKDGLEYRSSGWISSIQKYANQSWQIKKAES